MQQVSLSDKLMFKKINEEKVIIKCNIKELENEDNIVYKAAIFLKSNNHELSIYLRKQVDIP